MTLGMTIAILLFLIWGVRQVFRWTFKDDEEPGEGIDTSPYGSDKGRWDDHVNRR